MAVVGPVASALSRLAAHFSAVHNSVGAVPGNAKFKEALENPVLPSYLVGNDLFVGGKKFGFPDNLHTTAKMQANREKLLTEMEALFPGGH